jgi:hypothetical protein
MTLRALAPVQNIDKRRKRNPGGLRRGKGWSIAKMVLVGLLAKVSTQPCIPLQYAAKTGVVDLTYTP